MGTRADFYAGRGPEAEWLGSIAWDGYPKGVFHASGLPQPSTVTDMTTWRADVSEFLDGRDDGTTPDRGWPWPWDDSGTTDYSYAFDDGKVWGSFFGGPWFDASQPQPDEEDEAGSPAVHPDMSDRKNPPPLGSMASGVIAL